MKMLIKIDKLEHGKEIPGKLGRYCRVHGIHGRFFQCSEFPRQVNEAIRVEERRWLSASGSIMLTIVFVILLVVTALR